ncbi:MAG TPA: hypothetical protein VN026_17250 [Bacteroidia bacterium]|jgi:hypothetical protein|nr:hypothetical protein [Bacteroidia bacterium]
MTKKEISVGNKLIAEFMGAKEGNPKGRKNKVYVNVPIWHGKKMQTWTMTAKDLQYNFSWNWLMPVVHKAYDITSDDDKSFNGLNIFEYGLATDIKDLHKAVVEFIEWYNEKIKNN